MKLTTISENVDRLVFAIAEAYQNSAGSGKPEAILRQQVQPVLGEALLKLGVRSIARNEATLSVPPTSEASLLSAS